MKFKIDENLPVEAAELFRGAGHEADTVADEGMVGEDDATLIEVCKREDRAIVTHDQDFSDILTYPPADYPGIVVLRPRRQDKPHVLRRRRSVVANLASEPLRERLWIVSETRIRIRE